MYSRFSDSIHTRIGQSGAEYDMDDSWKLSRGLKYSRALSRMQKMGTSGLPTDNRINCKVPIGSNVLWVNLEVLKPLNDLRKQMVR